jgi:UDP-glucose 4-epimerase
MELRSACEGVDAVIHCAAVNEIESAQDPVKALHVNGQGSLRLLLAAQRANVERFIYVSTAHVYGAPLAGDICEETLARPTHPYAISHRTAEDFVLAAHDLGVMIGLVVRLSNGIGAPVDSTVKRWTLIVNDLCRQCVESRTITLRSGGQQSRDFVTLTDVSRCMLHMLGMPRQQCSTGLFNLGGANSMRVIDLAERIAQRCLKTLGFLPPITSKSGTNEQATALDYSIEKLRSTGFTLAGNMDHEIDETLRFCQAAFGKS